MSSFVSFYWSSDTCSLILKEQRVGFELWSEYQKLSQGSWAVCSKCGPWRIPTYPPGKDRNLKCLCTSNNLLNKFAFSGFNNKNQSLVFSIFLFPSILLFITFYQKNVLVCDELEMRSICLFTVDPSVGIPSVGTQEAPSLGTQGLASVYCFENSISVLLLSGNAAAFSLPCRRLISPSRNLLQKHPPLGHSPASHRWVTLGRVLYILGFIFLCDTGIMILTPNSENCFKDEVR